MPARHRQTSEPALALERPRATSDRERVLQEQIENEWLGLGDTTLIPTRNIFEPRDYSDIENPAMHVLGLMRKPEYFAFTCKHLLEREIFPLQSCLLWVMWHHAFPSIWATRGGSKTTSLGFYVMLRLILNQGIKVVVAGAAFRQSKFVFDVCQSIWQSSPVLRDIAGPGSGPRQQNDRCIFQVGESTAVFLPIGTGEKIRGERAAILIADEFSAQKVDIFENVVSGFAAVSMDPVGKMKAAGRRRAMNRYGVSLPDSDLPAAPGLNSNQTIIAGTCDYSFNHAYTYWKRYKAIVDSRGDPRVLNEIFGGQVPEKFDWRDYAVIRIPYDLYPEDYMDVKHIGKQRSVLPASRFRMEYSAIFAHDSDGFFKRSLIEQCVVGKPENPIRLPSCGADPVDFSAVLKGDQQRRYVIGIDPASESDNFAIVVVELWQDHRRIVYCWTTTRKRHKRRLSKSLVQEHDFFQYVATKVRELCRLFPCARIALDKMGGGVSVMEALGDPERLQPGEMPILPLIEEGVEKPTDRTPGDHILELCIFAKADWVAEANNGLKYDLESRTLLFPAFDMASVGLAAEEDLAANRVTINEDGDKESLYDTLEDCVMDLEELKEELASIVHTQTSASGRDRWDTPESRTIQGKKVRSRKDRYSALLMANMAARTMSHVQPRPQYYSTGGFAEVIKGRGVSPTPKGHLNPHWYEAAVGEGKGARPGAVVRRGRR